MSNVLKFCGCPHCRYGLHRGSFGGFVTKAAHRKLRRQTKQDLKAGREPPSKISVPYTD